MVECLTSKCEVRVQTLPSVTKKKERKKEKVVHNGVLFRNKEE
jgi:hypothetical protein